MIIVIVDFSTILKKKNKNEEVLCFHLQVGEKRVDVFEVALEGFIFYWI